MLHILLECICCSIKFDYKLNVKQTILHKYMYTYPTIPNL